MKPSFGCAQLAVLLFVAACDEGSLVRPRIVEISAPERVEPGTSFSVEAALEGPDDGWFDGHWNLVGPGTLRSERFLRSPVFTASAEIQALDEVGTITAQLVLETDYGVDHAERTIGVGNEAPCLSSLRLVHEDGEEETIAVPELGAEVRVRPGEEFSLIAKATDYDGDSVEFLWILESEAAAQGDAEPGEPFSVVSDVSSPVLSVVASSTLSSAALSLRIRDGKEMWENTVAVLRTSAEAPVIERINLPVLPQPGDEVAVDADVSFDATTTVAYDWSIRAQADVDFAFGSFEPTTSFTVLDGAGTYSVCLDIVDGYGRSDSKCADLVVPTDWQYEGELASTPYLSVVPPNDVYAITFFSQGFDANSAATPDPVVVVQHLDRRTREVSVLGSVPTSTVGGLLGCSEFYEASGGFYCVSGSSFYDSSLYRIEASAVGAVDDSDEPRSFFMSAGQLWMLSASSRDAILSWQRLDHSSWTPAGQASLDVSISELHLAAGRSSGRFLALVSTGDGSTAVVECEVAGGCHSAGTIQESWHRSGFAWSSDDRPVFLLGFAWASDDRPMLLHTGGVWVREVEGDWRDYPLGSSATGSGAWAAGDGRACLVAVDDAAGAELAAVQCYGQDGWATVGRPNVGGGCADSALAVAEGTVYFACNGRLYTHAL